MPPFPPAFKKILVADWIAHMEFNRKIWNDTNLFQFSLASVLPQIQAPVRILWGDQDKMLDVGSVVFLEKNLKNFRTVIMRTRAIAP